MITEQRLVEVSAGRFTVEHMVCCAIEVGEVSPTLCGAEDPIPWDGSWIEDVPPEDRCVVCVERDAQDYCPLRGRCPYGDSDFRFDFGRA